MKRLPEFRERGNLGARTMLCRPENQGEKNMLVLKLKKKSVSDMSGDKVASAQIPVDQPHPLSGFKPPDLGISNKVDL